MSGANAKPLISGTSSASIGFFQIITFVQQALVVLSNGRCLGHTYENLGAYLPVCRSYASKIRPVMPDLRRCAAAGGVPLQTPAVNVDEVVTPQCQKLLYPL